MNKSWDESSIEFDQIYNSNNHIFYLKFFKINKTKTY